MNPRLKNAQQDSDGIAQANQSLPLAQSQTEPNLDCGSNDVQAVSQEQANSSVGEVSSSHEPVSTTSGVSSSVNYSDSDDADDCPVFEYSAESMQVAKDSKDSPEITSNEAEQVAEENMENDEDLVQLDDDEHFGNETGISEDQAHQTQDEIEANKSIESPAASPETTTNTGAESLSNNEGENNEQPLDQQKITEDVSESEEHIAENSEAQCSSNGHQAKDDKKENRKTGIEGMDTEMISEDEHELHDDQVSKDLKADKENNNQKSDRDDSFKKVTKSKKERNYRDKKDKVDSKKKTKSRRSRSRSSFSRSRTRSRSRSKSKSRRSRSRSRSRSKLRLRSRTRSKTRSRSRSNRNRRNNRRPRRKDFRDKRQEFHRRQEIQRYDVRTVIADRQPRSFKDRYGRDNSRPPRSITPRKKSRSISRSASPGKCQK